MYVDNYKKIKIAHKRISAVLLAAALILVTGLSFAQASVSIGIVTGYVTATSADGEVKRVKDGEELKEGDVINTGNESKVSIVLANGETITLGPLDSYTVGQIANKGSGGTFAPRSLTNKSPTLSTATSAGGGISDPNAAPVTTPPAVTPDPVVTPDPDPAPDPTPTTPPPGGSPT